MKDVGSHGIDPATGEELPFITVVKGDPFVTVTKTQEGIERMRALALGFPQMLGGPQCPADRSGVASSAGPSTPSTRINTAPRACWSA